MDLRLFDVLVAFAGLCLLLLVGTALRQRLRWLRALGIPEALIAGLIGLLIGPFGPWRVFPEQVYDIWSQTPGVLISLVFATLFLGQRLPSPRVIWNRAASQTAFGMVLGFGQYLVGGLLVLLVLQPLFGTSPLMAALIEVGFEGGHGTAAGLGPTFRELGLPAGETLGLAMATVGVLTAVLLGSTLVVIGRARQWLAREDSSPAASAALDPMSAEERLNLERASGTVDQDSPRSMTSGLCPAPKLPWQIWPRRLTEPKRRRSLRHRGINRQPDHAIWRKDPSSDRGATHIRRKSQTDLPARG